MAIHRDDSGKRWVEVKVEVPGSPDEVWRAIATDKGISSWFVPTRTEYDSDGKPVKLICDFGPGMESVSKVTNWNPPHLLEAESKDLGEDAPSIATQWIVEAKDGNVCVVRVVHSLFASTDDWDNQLEGWEGGWPSFFRLLRLYLAHFPDQDSALLQHSAFLGKPRDAAWKKLTTALGFNAPVLGERCDSSGSAPALGGIVEQMGDDAYHEELLIRLDRPAPGIAHLFAMEMGEQVMLSLRFYLYGDTATVTKDQEEPVWQSWISEQLS